MIKQNYENKSVTFVNTAPVDIHGIKAGSDVDIECDHEGTPLNRLLRRRVKDGDCLVKKVKAKKRQEVTNNARNYK